MVWMVCIENDIEFDPDMIEFETEDKALAYATTKLVEAGWTLEAALGTLKEGNSCYVDDGEGGYAVMICDTDEME